MAPDDHERTFEKALARHLRPDAPGEAGASHPDAEILAAYHERSLPSQQMISWKGHIAGCAQCQEILAQLEATDELPIAADRQERQSQNVSAMPEPGLPDLAHVAAQPPMPGGSRTIAARWSRRYKMSPGADWRWLAPAGALAAGLLLWVAFHENKPPQFQLAKNQQLGVPSPAPAALPPLPAPANKEAVSKAVPSPSGDARFGVHRETDALTQNQRATLDEKKSASAQGDKLTAPSVARSRNAPSAPVDRDAHRSDITAGISAETTQPQQQTRPSASSPAPPGELQDNSARAARNMVVLSPSTSETSPKAKSVGGATSRPAPQEQPATGAVAGLRESSAMRMANARSSVTVSVPDSAVLWRVTSAGLIERSTDAGATWALQVSGVVADLLAGSAPSVKVCWIVGRSGTILRTTDGGAHWLKVSSPINDDLAAVFAVDAQQATVSAASSNKTYKTLDAGQTWTPVPTQ
jgi:hypothetical protein